MSDVVYVIGAPGSGRVKIGWSNDVNRRLGEIQGMSPVLLEVQMTVDGDHELETALHQHFKAFRTHGEWFDLGENAVERVSQALATSRVKARKTEAQSAEEVAIRRIRRARGASREALREAIAAAAKSGVKPGNLIHASGLSTETVRKICRESGVPPLRSVEGRVRGLPIDV